MTVMKSFAALFAIIVGLSQVTLAGEGHSSPALDSINGQIAAFQKQIDDLAAKAATEKQKLNLQKQAKVISTKIHYEATQSIEKIFQAQTKPIRDNIATLRLRAFEIRQESGMAEPATGKRKR